MTANSPAESSLYPRPNDDCITAELVSVTESKSLHQNAAGNLAALSGENTVFEPSVTEIPVTESFEFNYLNFGGSPPPPIAAINLSSTGYPLEQCWAITVSGGQSGGRDSPGPLSGTRC